MSQAVWHKQHQFCSHHITVIHILTIRYIQQQSEYGRQCNVILEFWGNNAPASCSFCNFLLTPLWQILHFALWGSSVRGQHHWYHLAHHHVSVFPASHLPVQTSVTEPSSPLSISETSLLLSVSILQLITLLHWAHSSQFRELNLNSLIPLWAQFKSWFYLSQLVTADSRPAW